MSPRESLEAIEHKVHLQEYSVFLRKEVLAESLVMCMAALRSQFNLTYDW